jgi:hypothetical protein
VEVTVFIFVFWNSEMFMKRSVIKSIGIRIILRSSFVTGLICFSSMFLNGQQVKFTTAVSSKQIGRGDYLQVEYLVENAKQIENLDLPGFPDFRIIEGPMQSSGMSVVNGNMTQYKGVSYILQPINSGTFKIPGAIADVDGQHMHSETVSVEVIAGSTGRSGNINPMLLQPNLAPEAPEVGDREYLLKPGEDIGEKTRKNIFVRLNVDKTSCYVGEPIVATYKLYSRVHSESRVTKNPSLNGFSVYDMVDPNNDVATVENLNGKPFNVHVIRKAQLIPLQPGPVELSEAEVENTVHYRKPSEKPRQSRDALQDLFDQLSDEGGEEVQQHITLTSKPLTIQVKSLPDINKPSDFNGAVGDFRIESTVDKKQVEAQDAVKLKVKLSGSGNLPIVDAPLVSWPSGIDSYGTSATEDIDRSVAPMKGSKTFIYTFMPVKPGVYDIPSIQFSYFDPSSATYKSISTQALQLTASPARKSSSHSIFRSLSSGNQGGILLDLKRLLADHLEWIVALIFLTLGGIMILKYNARALKREDASRRSKEDESLSLAIAEEKNPPAYLSTPEFSLLSSVKRTMEQGNQRDFYAGLNRAIWEALSEKLHLPGSEMNKYQISMHLRRKGWDEIIIMQLEDLLNQCEINLYSPDHRTADMELLFRQGEQIIKYIQGV